MLEFLDIEFGLLIWDLIKPKPIVELDINNASYLIDECRNCSVNSYGIKIFSATSSAVTFAVCPLSN